MVNSLGMAIVSHYASSKSFAFNNWLIACLGKTKDKKTDKVCFFFYVKQKQMLLQKVQDASKGGSRLSDLCDGITDRPESAVWINE